MGVNNGSSVYNEGITYEDVQNIVDEKFSDYPTVYTPKGEASVSTLNGMSTQNTGDAYQLTDAGTLTEGNISVNTGDTVAWDGSKWFVIFDYSIIETKANKDSVIVFDENDTVVNNKYFDSEGNIQNSSTGGDGSYWCITDYIELNGSKKYWYKSLNKTGSVAVNSCFYDSSKNFISSFHALSGYYNFLDVPSSAKYVRFSILNSGGLNFRLFENDSSLLKTDSVLKTISGDNDRALSFSVCINGDSIETEASGIWPELVKNYFPWLAYKNIAVGGTLMTGNINSVARINGVPSACTLSITGGGTNDWAQNIEIGTLQDIEDSSKFVGAVNLLIKHLHDRVPNAKIILLSNPFGCCPNRFNSSHDNTKGYFNDIDLTLKDYADAIKMVAEFNSVQYIPVYEECGINQYNYMDYMLEQINQDGDTVFLHPNNKGAQKIFSVVSKYINNIIKTWI